MKAPVTSERQRLQPAADMPRRRDREKTQEELRFAMLRVKNKGLKVSISAVAREAGVDASLIHHTYPDIAEAIRAIAGRSTRGQRDEMRADLAAVRQRLREVTAEREQLKREMAVLASVNLALSEQLAGLKAQVDAKVQRMGPGAPVVSPTLTPAAGRVTRGVHGAD